MWWAAALTSKVDDARKQGFERALDGRAELGQRQTEKDHDDSERTGEGAEPDQDAERRHERGRGSIFQVVCVEPSSKSVAELLQG